MLNTIFLIGYMGVGKSVIGKSLSKNNGFNFYDLDKYIEEKEGKKISEIFSDNNEIYFRKIENNYLKEISQIKENKIISTGGGTPCFQNNLEIIDGLPSSISVYLKATANTLADRLKDSIEKRPLISHLQNPVELKEFITKHLFERSFYYEKSKVKIKTDDLDVNAVVKLINQLLT